MIGAEAGVMEAAALQAVCLQHAARSATTERMPRRARRVRSSDQYVVQSVLLQTPHLSYQGHAEYSGSDRRINTLFRFLTNIILLVLKSLN